MNNVNDLIATRLLEIEAVKVQPDSPFTWASGWLSPFYCDNRKTLSYPDLRGLIRDSLCKLIEDEFPSFDTVAGVATGAIAQGALVADVVTLCGFGSLRTFMRVFKKEEQVTPGQYRALHI